jgi:hypothetical protein
MPGTPNIVASGDGIGSEIVDTTLLFSTHGSCLTLHS